MSKKYTAIDQWLDELQFENYRLSFLPPDFSSLGLQIQKYQSQPVSAVGGNLHIALNRLETLKRDHAFLQQVEDYVSQGKRLVPYFTMIFNKDPSHWQQNPILRARIDENLEIFDGIVTWFDKSKIAQRERQWRHLRSLKQYWPQADEARKRRIAGLFKTYFGRRLAWGILHSALARPTKVGRWAMRHVKRITLHR